MMKRTTRVKLLLLIGCYYASSLLAAPTDIVFWHSMAGQIGATVNHLAAEFNQSQTAFRVKPIYKGDYVETLTSFAAAFQAHHPPALVQIFEVGTPTMLQPKGIIKPVFEVMQEQGLTLPVADFFPAVRDYYSQGGELMAMPFNVSVPAMYYNRAALAKVHWDENKLPTTWKQLEHLVKRLKQQGYPCGYTSAYPAWVLLESFSALHNLPMIDVNEQQALYDKPAYIKHLRRLLHWQRLHYYEYGGRLDEGMALFTSGYCPILSQSSGSYGSLSASTTFGILMGPMPLDEHLSPTRFTNVAGGGAIWVIAGQTEPVYQGVAQFLLFLAKPETQKYWQKETGYLPLGVKGQYQALLKQNHPSLILANKEFNEAPPHISPRLHNHIRAINDETLEAIFARIKSPETALHEAVRRVNEALLRFKRNTEG